MQWLRDYRFKWRVRRARLALQSAGYVALPFDGSSILAFHWADPQNRILFQPSRTDTWTCGSYRKMVRLHQNETHTGQAPDNSPSYLTKKQ